MRVDIKSCTSIVHMASCVCRRGALDADGLISCLPLADTVVDDTHQEPSLIYMRVIYEHRCGDQCLIACYTYIHMYTCIDLEHVRVLSLLRLRWCEDLLRLRDVYNVFGPVPALLYRMCISIFHLYTCADGIQCFATQTHVSINVCCYDRSDVSTRTAFLNSRRVNSVCLISFICTR